MIRRLFVSLATAVLGAPFLISAPGGLGIMPETDPGTPENFRLVWDSETGRTYTLEESTNLDNWTAGAGGRVTGTGEVMHRDFIQGPENRFFRLLVAGEQLLNLPLPEDGTRYDSYEEIDGPRWPDTYGEGHVTLWHKGKFAAYSITIDDNNSPDFPFWLNVGETYGWQLTWFVIVHPYVWDIYNNVPGNNTGYFGTLEEFRILREEGHDIQLHGACSSMNDLDNAAYEDHITRSMNVLGEAIGTPIQTFAYPCGKLSNPEGTADYREIISRHMLAARGGSGGGTTPVHLLDYLTAKSLGVNALVDGEPSTLFARVWDKRNFLYSQYRGWAVTLYHGLDESGRVEALETLDYVKAHEDELWVDCFTDVAKYAQERESSTLDITLVEADRIEFFITDRMDDAVFTHPLTVKIRLDSSWTSIGATQDGQPIAAYVVEHEGAFYGYIEPIPDRGKVVLDRLAAAE